MKKKGDRKEIKGVKQELKPDLSDKIVKQERSIVPNAHATQFADVSYPTPHFEPPNQRPLSAPQCHGNELSALIINEEKINHLPVKEPPVFSGVYFEYPAFVTAILSSLVTFLRT